MNDRQRTTLLGFVLAIGFVSPFVLGFVAEPQLPLVQIAAGTAHAASADGQPDWSSPRLLRSRFDAVQIGMTDDNVRLLLGEPSQDEWIDPTHAETWLAEKTGIAHEKWDPPWKVYWLLTQADGNSRWWSSVGCQAFVDFDDTGKVKDKMWLEHRRQSEASRVVLPALAFAVAGCGIWLAVRIVNRRKHYSRRMHIAGAVFSLLVAYVISFGPACWISSRLGTGYEVVSRIYQPILKIAFASPRFISVPIWSYGSLCAAEGWVFSGNCETTDEHGVKTVDDTCRWMPNSP